MTQAILSIGIHGATGRMGTRLMQLIADDPALELAAALERIGHPQLGQDAGTLAGSSPVGVCTRLCLADDRKVDVMIDFSLPQGSIGVRTLLRRAQDPAGRRHHRIRLRRAR